MKSADEILMKSAVTAFAHLLLNGAARKNREKTSTARKKNLVPQFHCNGLSGCAGPKFHVLSL